MKIAVKEVGKPLVFMETNKKYRGDVVKSYIIDENGHPVYPEYVRLTNSEGYGAGLYFAVDEEGLMRKLPRNFLLAMDSDYWPIQEIVGTVVFFRAAAAPEEGEIWDFEVEDLNREDIDFIETILSQSTQKELSELFNENHLGPGIVIKSDSKDNILKMLFGDIEDE